MADGQPLNLAVQTGRLIDMDRRLEDAQRLIEEQLAKHTEAMIDWNSRWGEKIPK